MQLLILQIDTFRLVDEELETLLGMNSAWCARV